MTKKQERGAADGAGLDGAACGPPLLFFRFFWGVGKRCAETCAKMFRPRRNVMPAGRKNHAGMRGS